MVKIKLPDFIIIPYPLLEDGEITLIDERLYGIIYWFSKMKNEKCTASNNILAELVKTTSTTIQNSLTKLEEKAYIKRKFKDKARKHRLEIIPLVVFSKVSLTDDTDELVSPTDDSVSPTSDTVVSPTDDQNKNIVNKNNKEESETSFAGRRINDLIDSFEPLNPLYRDFYSNKTERAALEAMADRIGYEKLLATIKALPAIVEQKYAPKVTKPSELRRDFGKLLAFYKQSQNLRGIIL